MATPNDKQNDTPYSDHTEGLLDELAAFKKALAPHAARRKKNIRGTKELAEIREAHQHLKAARRALKISTKK